MLFVLFGALVFCGIVMDAVHGLVGVSALGRLVGIVEDGGEVIVAAVTCTYALSIAKATRRASAD